MFLNIFFAFLSVGLLGGLFGVGLALASHYLAVEKDGRIDAVEAILPGANCGACGYPGCSGYAEAIVMDEAELTLCSPGGKEVVAKLADFMGVSVEVADERQVAQVHCRGNRSVAAREFAYTGITDCNAAHILYQGDKVCKFGCLGFGSCIKVCPVDAISRDGEGNIWIDRELCIACGKCIHICPTGVIKMIPYDADYIVACNSTDKGGIVKKYCSVGCIGCKMCDRKAPDGGFIIENFLASINYKEQGDRSLSAASCPSHCIIAADTAEVPPKESRTPLKAKEAPVPVSEESKAKV